MAGPSYSPGPGFGAFVNQLANPPNPMDQLGKTVNALTAVKNFQAEKAMADIYSQAIDPTTGQVDQGKLNSLIGANPAAAWNAGPAMQQAGQAVGAQGAGTQAQVKAQADQLNLLNGYAAPLIQSIDKDNAQITPDQVRAVLNNAIGITPQMRAAVEQKLNQLQPGESANGLLKGFQFATQSAESQASREFPTIGQNAGIAQWLGAQSAPWPDKNDPRQMHYGTNADRLEQQAPGSVAAITGGLGGGGFGPSAGRAAPAPQTGAPPAGGAPAASVPPPNAGSTPGAGNWEVQHNNFAGMRNPNVPAAGGPNTNPSGWQQFPTPEAGVQAISNQLDRYASGATTGKPLTTLRGIISTWAPASDGNPTPALINRASQIVGVGPDQPLNLSDPNVKAKLVEAMIRNEQGGALPQAAATAIPKVFGGAPGTQVAQAPGAATDATLVPGGGAQLQPTPVSFPTGGAGTAPITLQKTTEASGEQFNQARALSTNFEDRVSNLNQALGLLRQNKTLNVGPGTSDLQALQGIARAWNIDLPQAMQDNNTAFSEINKDLERYYRSLPGSDRSDLAQIEAKSSQPSAQTQQREALDDLIVKTIGRERMLNAAYQNFAQVHGPQASMYAPEFADETAKFMQGLDPVGFSFNLMTPQERTTYRDSLKGPALTNYYNSIKTASRIYGLPITGQ